MNRFKDRKGFTLIELLVVIAIVSILASIVLVSLRGARQKGRDVARISELRNLALALASYYDDNPNAGYPNPAGTTGAERYNNLSSFLAPTYINSLPSDPGTGAYEYGFASDRQDYTLKATLETHNAGLDRDADGTSNSLSCGTNGATEREYCIRP